MIWHTIVDMAEAMDSGSNLQARALFCSKCWRKKKKKKKKNANHLKGDDFTSDPSLVIFVFFKNLTFIANWDFTFQASIFGRSETRTTHVTIV